MQISKRLETVAGMVTPGLALADVGTDHAYIPIYLVGNQIVPRAVAMDIGRGPLARAQEHIRAYGLEAQIETRLSDGLDALAEGEAQSIVIAGMGGQLAVRILTKGAAQAMACREVILQPQSELRLVRSYLYSAGYRILQEELVYEGGKFYPMMKCVPKGQSDWAEAMAITEPGLRFGPLLLAGRHPVLREYLLREYRLNGRILKALSVQTGERAAVRRAEVEQEQAYVEQALALYEV